MWRSGWLVGWLTTNGDVMSSIVKPMDFGALGSTRGMDL